MVKFLNYYFIKHITVSLRVLVPGTAEDTKIHGCSSPIISIPHPVLLICGFSQLQIT